MVMNYPTASPPWLQWAWKEIGAHETGDNRGAVVQRYIDLSHCGELGDPWCAIFANAALEDCGIKGTHSPSSQSFRHNANFVQLEGPAIGAVTVFWRISRKSGLGHVGFYCGERHGLIWTCGGNENDQVQVEFLAKSASTFGLVGYFWPKSVALPKIEAVVVSDDLPAHVTKVS